MAFGIDPTLTWEAAEGWFPPKPRKRVYEALESLEAVRGRRPRLDDPKYKPSTARRLGASGAAALATYVNMGRRTAVPEEVVGNLTGELLRPGYKRDVSLWEEDLQDAERSTENAIKLYNLDRQEAEDALRRKQIEASIEASEASAEAARARAKAALEPPKRPGQRYIATRYGTFDVETGQYVEPPQSLKPKPRPINVSRGGTALDPETGKVLYQDTRPPARREEKKEPSKSVWVGIEERKGRRMQAADDWLAKELLDETDPERIRKLKEEHARRIRAAQRAYENEIIAAGGSIVPRGQSGMEAIELLSDSTTTKVFPAEKLEAFAKSKGITVDEARRQLVKNGWQVR